jgi:ABC-type antimicrobial peptide transport system permease subunit
MQIGRISGRLITERDSAGAAPVAVINEAYAKRFFPDQNPLHQYLTARVRGTLQNLEIIGIVRNVHSVSLRTPPRSTVYVSYAQLTGDFPTTMEFRVSGRIAETAAAITRTLQRRLPDTAVEVRPLAAQVEAVMVQERMMAALAGGVGALAVITACVGLYGLIAYRVSGRTRELAIRMALGARRNQVLGLMLQGAGRLLLLGIALGLPVSWAASRWIKALLFGVTATDPVTIGGATLVMIIIALAAAFLPAYRASRVEPISALRHD